MYGTNDLSVSGVSADKAVASISTAMQLVADGGTIVVCGKFEKLYQKLFEEEWKEEFKWKFQYSKEVQVNQETGKSGWFFSQV